ncbi:protein serine/threonine phosphatase 2C [Delitschia confertaspora ATCC 74209]|uniref:Protein serine/threonine phosphatase 2C n=1 Tax=Delitschia confertaspora ATCC 74209 TaxID=1513339 RepID=A0A9P4JHT0_9PLEO|nr:protein serine/threonine phosphatase 2C [Delitschia confertaspora ATCC 74209]
MWKPTIRISRASRRLLIPRPGHHRPLRPYRQPHEARRCFHEYFVSHLPSASLYPDSRLRGQHHKLPREKFIPHEVQGGRSPPPVAVPMVGRDTTVVRIPLKSAKHHFGVSLSRGTRAYNEDAFQAGTIDFPAFAKRRPISLTRRADGAMMKDEVTPADGPGGDPQVFYFGVFDGHGGNECSDFLREQLHTYVEEGARLFELESSLKRKGKPQQYFGWPSSLDDYEKITQNNGEDIGKKSLDAIKMHTPPGTEPIKPPQPDEEPPTTGANSQAKPLESDPPTEQSTAVRKAEDLERALVYDWKQLVGGYFRRFKPEYFSISAGGRGHPMEKDAIQKRHNPHSDIHKDIEAGVGIETVLEYAFLKADYDFVSAQVGKQDEDPVLADKALNDDDILGQPSKRIHKHIGGSKRFKGGSTCSVALISTPTVSPFWHPASPSTLITAHVGDTRILLCNTATGLAVPLTSNHHPSLPEEATRLRRYAASFVTDSFGEERVSGLANTRAFGDMASKRIGVSAEPEIRRIELHPAEYSFLVLVSDGVSGPLSDQEIVDIVKEAKTPEQAARDVTSFATEMSTDADNATTVVVRLGGWERRCEGGLGSMGTRELRDWRKEEANGPRRRT